VKEISRTVSSGNTKYSYKCNNYYLLSYAITTLQLVYSLIRWSYKTCYTYVLFIQ